MNQRLALGIVSATPVTAEPEALYTTVSQTRWVEVLVDCPGTQGLYTYQIPASLDVGVGDILSVPFGAQQLGAIAVRLLDQLPDDLNPTTVKAVVDIVSRSFFPATYWTLLHQVAQYYCTPLMQVIRGALPPGLLGRSQRRIRLKPEAIPPGASAFLHASAREVLERLQAQKQGDYTWQYLQRQVRGADRGLRDLLQRGWVESYLEPPTPIRPKRQRAVVLTDAAPPTDLSSRQQEILEVLKRRGGDLWLQELLQICQVSSSVLKTLERKGCLVIQQREVLRADDIPAPPADQPKPLTPAQAESVAAIAETTGYTQVLLHGVTGSGKTEVYLQAIAPILQQGKSALVLVPEIGLTPQLTDRFRARFGATVRVYHSALSDGERYDTWRQMLSNSPQIIIGTRSAVFAPLPALGIIILDEEHDGSFKQDQPAPCYHARRVAEWRAELANCPLVLGSATPSLETWLRLNPPPELPEVSPPDHPSPLTQGSTQTAQPASLYLSLPQRIQARPMPPIQVIDMRQEFRQGNRSIFSRALQTALHTLQEKQQQGILFIHRRGHSTFVSCRSCGHVLGCRHCDVSLTYHQTQTGGFESLRCHYCGYGRSHPRQCPECGSPYLKHFGSGTQRVTQELAEQFPTLRYLRFDSDTTRLKGAHRALLSQFAQGEADLLVGTQMLTKGIDLPQVTLVGVVAADGLLHLADYRASERAFQTLVQVAGRAGRGADPGNVILQTYSPHHPVIEAVQRYEYEVFAATELTHRAELNYPPHGRLIVLRLSGMDETTVGQTAEQIADSLRSPAQAAGYEVLGPAPAAIARVARRYRWQILLKAPLSATLDLPDLVALRSRCPQTVSLTIDIDPLNLL